MQRSIWILVTLVMVAVCAPNRPAFAQSQDPDWGKSAFLEHCAPCHGASGQGDGPRAGTLKIAPVNLARLASENGGVFPTAKVTDVIEHGGAPLGHGTDMPAWTKVFGVKGDSAETRDRIKRLVQYIESLQK